MAVQITIDIFSGRPNPVLQISPAAAAGLFAAAPVFLAAPATPRVAQFPRLGYRGLVFQHDEPALANTLPLASRLYRGVLHFANSAAATPNIEAELTAPEGLGEQSGLPPGLLKFIATEISRAAEEPPPAPRVGPPPVIREIVPGSGRAPIFEPDWWNDGGIKQSHNNCYNYSSNYRTDTFAQPGRASGFEITAISCDQVRPFAVADNLVDDPVNNNEFPAEGHLVALVMAPGFDFHWYRKGPDGMWSHKIGPAPVTNLDNSGAPIADPRAADRGPYTDFCGFMAVMHGHIKLS